MKSGLSRWEFLFHATIIPNNIFFQFFFFELIWRIVFLPGKTMLFTFGRREYDGFRENIRNHMMYYVSIRHPSTNIQENKLLPFITVYFTDQLIAKI